jgi:hypothetical protein
VKRLCVAALLSVSACASVRPTTPPQVAFAETAGDAAGEQERGLLGRALTPIANAVLAEGYHATAPLTHAFLAPSARVVEPFTLAPRTCVAIVAVATATVTDLDAAIYAADGSALAEDDTTGARPIVRLCTGEQRLDAYLAFYAFQGTGSFAAQRLERPLGPADALGLAEAQRATLVNDQTPGFSELLRGLHGRGYEDDGPITEVPLVSGSAVRLASHVEAGRCYSAVADGTGMRVRLLDGAGREVALGVGATGPAALQYCAREDADLVLELSSAGSERTARLARLHAGQEAVGSARAVWLGEPSPAFAVGARNAKLLSAEPTCSASAREPAARAAKKLSALYADAPLSQGSVIERELRLSGCSKLAATLQQGLAVVTLRVEDAAGVVLAERDLLAPEDALAVCPVQVRAGEQGKQVGNYHVTLIGRAGFGALSLVLQACGD